MRIYLASTFFTEILNQKTTSFNKNCNRNLYNKIIVNPGLKIPHGNPVVVLPGRRSLLEASGSSGMESGWESLVVFKSRGHAQL
jgi:hypothetical protein